MTTSTVDRRASALGPFTRHPHAVGETYVEHMAQAFGFGTTMLVGGLACLVHGLLPFLCVTSGSRRIRALHQRMVTNRTTVHHVDLGGGI